MLNNQSTEQLLEQLKNEIAAELGIEIHADMTSRNAGKIGGVMVQKLIKLGEMKLAEMNNQNVNPTIINQTNKQQNYNQLH